MLNSSTSPTCPHNMANFGPLKPEIGWRVWGTPGNFASAFVTAATSLTRGQPNFTRCLAISWAFSEALAPAIVLPGAKLTLPYVKVLRSPIGSVTAQHSSSGRQRNFVALSRGRHLYSAGRPSRWASAYILVLFHFMMEPRVM